MTRTSWTRTWLVPALVPVLTACGDSPTRPGHAPASSALTAAVASSLSSPSLRMMVDDAAGRLSDALEQGDARVKLGAILKRLDASVRSGDLAGARRALALARTELRRQATLRGAAVDAADRDAIALSLDEVERILTAPADLAPRSAAK